jgi:maltooligosyltrehalose trehalohydrolase
MLGERLSTLVSREKLRLAAAAVILSPFVPMIFMGEEYGETAPFQYFTSHSDPDLIEAVRRGRLEEFDDFDWHGDPPDPHDEETFRRSRLTWKDDRDLRELYRELLRLRRDTAALRSLNLASLEAHADDERRTLLVRRDNVLLAFNFSDQAQTVDVPPGRWRPLMETGATMEGNRVILPAESFGVFGANSEPRAASSEQGPARRSPRAAR